MMPKIVILLGPPGAGKGTQAEILAEREGFFHFETSKVLEQAFEKAEGNDTLIVDGKTYHWEEERSNFASGKLVAPAIAAFLVAQKVRDLAKEGRPAVFSGSPRTLFEAERLLPLFEDLYGKDAIVVLMLVIPEAESIFRNTNRRICSRCRFPVPYFPETKGLTVCPKCGGALVRRVLDTPEVIKVRLREYAERTRPIAQFLRERGIAVREIDGTGPIDVVAERIRAALAAHVPDNIAVSHEKT